MDMVGTQNVAPIFIVAPSRRCGSTLLQRALNSTGTALVYGENFNFMENYPAIVAGVFSNVELKRSRTNEVRSRVLGGDYDIDASAMFPDYDPYTRLMRSHFFHIARYYEEQTRVCGRVVWGLKHQIRRLEGFSAFLQLMRTSCYVFLYRNVFDVARSDKARFPGDYSSPESFFRLGQNWARATEFMRAVVSGNVLHLEYEELSQRPNDTIARLQEHCRLSGIDSRVFQNRVNVSPIIDRLENTEKHTSYRRPAELSAAELAALRRAVEQACVRFGYALPETSA